MTTFIYKAKKDNADTVTGRISADTQEEAVELINQLGLHPVAVAMEERDAVDISKKDTVRRVKSKELYVFTRQLANLLKSGVSLLRGTVILEEQTHNKYLKAVIAKIAHGIKNGRTFSEMLSDFPEIFSPLYVTMVRAGEESGNLQEMLINISIFQKRQESISSKVRSALAYPILMATVGGLTIYFILTFVLPKMANLFENIQTDLPLPTILLLKLSHGLNEGFIWTLIGAVFLIAGIRQWLRSVSGKIFLSKFLLKIPLIGTIILKSELARFCRTMVLLHKGGVSIIRALEISIPIMSNAVIKASLMLCKEELVAGGSFGEGIKKIKALPVMIGHMISIGEESGNLNDVLNEIAETYENETNEAVKTMTTLLEPMMILVVGAVIGFIVFAMLMPIFQIDVFVQ